MSMSMNSASGDDFPDIQGLSEYIDLPDALGRLRGNRKIYKTLLKSFMGKNNIDELKAQISANDIGEAAKTIHTIKGIAANLSFTALQKSMVQLELELKAGSYSEETLSAGLCNYEKTKEFILILDEKL